MKVCISGATGKMGKQLLATFFADTNFAIVGAITNSHDFLAQDALAFSGQTSGIITTTVAEQAIAKADCLIDFTSPEATLQYLTICRRLGVKMVIGTTGFSVEQQQQIQQASQDIAIVMAPNMSIGVNVTLKLLELAAKTLPAAYDIEIIEAHHKHKVDAPSGTALAMGEIVAKARQTSLAESGVFSREGIVGARKDGSIGFACVRAGDIIGEHTVLFAGHGERVEISHKANNRQIYAQGSLAAAKFLNTKTTGIYNMFDVLGLS